MEALVEHASDAGNLVECIVMSLLLLSWSLLVQRQANIARRAEDLRRNGDANK
jgi:hypothetical protein